MSTRFDFLGVALLAATAILGAGACYGGSDDDLSETDGAVAVDSAQQAEVLWSDTQLAGLLVTADAIALAEAQLALTKAVDPMVLDFARTMIAFHTFNSQQVALVLAQIGAPPADSDLSVALNQLAAGQAAVLQSLAGPAFDRAYIDSQIQLDQAMLVQLQAQLAVVGVGWDFGVQSLVPPLRTTVAQHLQIAVSIRNFLGSPFPGGGPFPPPYGPRYPFRRF